MALVSNANVHNTCLRLLRDRGFTLHVEGELDEGGYYPVSHRWYATQGGVELCAYNPIELLGLAAIYEHHRPEEDTPYWWYVDGEDVRDELYEAAWPDDEDDEEGR